MKNKTESKYEIKKSLYNGRYYIIDNKAPKNCLLPKSKLMTRDDLLKLEKEIGNFLTYN